MGVRTRENKHLGRPRQTFRFESPSVTNKFCLNFRIARKNPWSQTLGSERLIMSEGIKERSKSDKKSRKRKLEQAIGEDDASPIIPDKQKSKAERKEAKRLKKSKKHAAKSQENAINSDLQQSSSLNQATSQGDVQQKVSHESPAVESGATGGLVDGMYPHGRTSGNGFSASYEEDATLATLSNGAIEEFLQKHGIKIQDPSLSASLRPIIDFKYLPKSSYNDSSTFTTFKSPTPIQAASWPFLLFGRDVIGVAETGSGKTLAFGIPLIRQVLATSHEKTSGSPLKAVVVSPTRELAMQIHEQLEALASRKSIRTVCIYGGVPKEDQRKALKKASIAVATPGRLNDLIQEGFADLTGVNYLVLDEADRMLDKGFEDEIRKIISSSNPSSRQTLMFTATWPPSVRDLASTFMRNPVHISIGIENPTGELRANKSITQIVEVVDPMQKQNRLMELLRKHQGKKGQKVDRVLIFALYKKEAARIESFLRSRGFSVAAIHGDMSQPARTASLDGFKTGKCPLLVATDVAARGLDIPEVELVVNLTYPLTTEDYVHRIGRTGRAGKTGKAITLFTEHDKAQAGGLVNVLKGAGQTVPEELLKFGTTVKKKGHDAYGAFYKDIGNGEKKQGTKIKF